MEDEKIVELYWLRSEQAITETAAKYGAYLLRIALRLLPLREDADECVNDTYLGAWNAIPPHRPKQLSLFLGKITRRAALDRLKSENRLKRGGGQASLAYEELASCLPDESAGDPAELAASRDRIERFLASLSEAERSVFICRYWYFAPVDEIAGRFGFSQSKVKSLLFRTRRKFGDFLAAEGEAYDKT